MSNQENETVINNLLADSKTKEILVMEYEKISRSSMLKKIRSKAISQGQLIIPNWLIICLFNIGLVVFLGLLTSSIMINQNPPGKSSSSSIETLKSNQIYNSTCFTWDDSCDKTIDLWCVDDRCQCYDQLSYWNGSRCRQCSTGFYYDGISCSCPNYSYLDISVTNSCLVYNNYSQQCTSRQCNPRSGLVCSSSQCLCPSEYYWNSTNNNDPNGYCVRYSSKSEYCLITSNCSPNRSLICLNGTCQCSSSNKVFWTGSSCVEIQTFNGTCLNDQQCDGTLLLKCNQSICVCAGSTPYGTWFWNGTQCVLCPLGWLNYEIYCYYNSQTASTWNNSRAYCQRYGADLLVIENQAEFDFIKPNAVAILGAKGLAFIGYYTSSYSGSGTFSWIDSSLGTFTGDHSNQPWWCPPQPTFSVRSTHTPTIQGCGAIQLYGSDVCLNDWWFSDLLPFICKKSQ